MVEGAAHGRWRDVLAPDFLGQIVETFGTRVSLIAVGVVTSVLVARTLGPSGRGLYAVAATISGIGVQLGNLGLQSANTYYVARDRSLLPSIAGNSLVVGLGVGSGGAALLAILFLLMPSLAPLSGPLLYGALGLVPLGLTYLFLQNILIGIQAIRPTNVIELSTRILGVTFIAGLVGIGSATPESLFFAGYAPALGALLWTFKKVHEHAKKAFRVSREVFVRALRYGTKAYLIALLSFLVIRSDLLMVQYMRGAEEAGQYSIAVTLADFAYLFALVVATILFPRLSSMDDPRERWVLASRVALLIGIVSIAGVSLGVLIARPGIELLYGPVYEPATGAFLWLLPGIAFLGVETILAQFLAASGLPRSLVVAWLVSLGANIAMNVVLISRLGFEGAAVASTITYGLTLVLVSVLALRRRSA